MSEQPESEIRVRDRRRFTAEGEAKSDHEIDPAPEAEGPTAAEPPLEPEAAPEPPSEFTPPPASLGMLVVSLAMQAEMELGLHGEAAKAPNLALAQHSIDLLGVLKDKTQGNLTMEEQRLLENTLTELRFRYVQKVQEINEQAKGGADPGA